MTPGDPCKAAFVALSVVHETNHDRGILCKFSDEQLVAREPQIGQSDE